MDDETLVSSPDIQSDFAFEDNELFSRVVSEILSETNYTEEEIVVFE